MPAPHPRMHGISHVRGGPDPIPGLPPGLGGDTLDAAILGLAPGGFWKLNESSGTVAADSSGNGLDLTVAGTGDPITWAQTAGPPGEQTARFNHHNRVVRSWPSFGTAASFTAGLWFKWNLNNAQLIMGQGAPSRAGWNGWQLAQNSTGTITAHGGGRVIFELEGVTLLDAVNATTVGAWQLIVGVYDHTVPEARLYIDAVLQGTISASGYTPYIAGPDLWIGYDSHTSFPGGSGGTNTFDASYAFVYPVALTGPEITDIFNHAGSTGFTEDGLVLTSNGFGASSWEPPTILVTY